MNGEAGNLTMQPSEEESRTWQACCAIAYVLQLLVVGLLLDYVLLSGLQLHGFIRLSVVAFILAGVVRSYGWLVLVAIQIKLFFLEPGSTELALSLGSLLYCLCSLFLISYALAAQRIVPKLSRRIAGLIMELIMELIRPESQSESRGAPRGRQFGTTLGIWGITLTAAVFFAVLLLAFLPLTRQSSRGWLQQSLSNDGFLWPGPTIVVLVLFFFILIREIAWRQANRAQASLWLRSWFMLDHRRDLLMIVRRRLRAKKKAASAGRSS